VKTAWKVVKCSKQFALIAVKNAKFPSNLTAQDQYTAKSALPREDRKGQILAEEDTRHRIR
jgi:3-hydroxymyristoyl/3-hydroxydecanoyl-(acyl carrier protein) dehydratase